MNLRVLGAVLILFATASASLSAEQPPLYRIFLHDGTSLVSYGEYARLADRVVFSLPIGPLEPAPKLQMVSIEDSTVDWRRTEDYSDAVRARRYAQTRGEHDFAVLSEQVAAALNDVALTKDPAIRLAMAEGARKKLAEWPKQNFGYRAADVTQLLWLFDDVVSELRAAAGLSRYDVALYANTVPPAPRELLAAPDLRSSVEQAMMAARLTKDSSERMSLLRAVTAALNSNDAPDWQDAIRLKALEALTEEERISTSYGDLTKRTLETAVMRTRRADVMGLQQLIRAVLDADDRLGRHRPNETSALLALLDQRLDEARRLRLARDAWQLRAGVLASYRGKVAAPINHLVRSLDGIKAIRELAGPTPQSLRRLERRMQTAKGLLAALKPPAEVQSAHSMLATAVTMAARAAATRRNAITTADINIAWEASAAAAGALLMFEQARDEINKQTSFPQLR